MYLAVSEDVAGKTRAFIKRWITSIKSVKKSTALHHVLGVGGPVPLVVIIILCIIVQEFVVV
jgi:hypothetical protein